MPGGTLIIESLVDKDGKDFLQKVKVGDRFFTPQQKLSERFSRVVYNPKGLK